MRDDHGIATPVEEVRQNLLNRICVHDHAVVDARELGDAERNRHARVHENIHAIDDLVVPELHRTDLDDVVGLGTEAGGLDIENDRVVVEALPLLVLHDGLEVIDEIALAAVDQLEVLVVLDLLQVNVGVREGLHDAVVRDRHRLHAEGNRGVDVVIDIGHAVHVGHLRMQMQLHALLRRAVLPLRAVQLIAHDPIDEAHLDLLVEGVVGHGALDLQRGTRLHEALRELHILVLDEDLHGDRVGEIGDVKLEDILTGTGVHRIMHEEDLPCHDNVTGARVDILELHRIALEVAPVEHLLVLGHLKRPLPTLEGAIAPADAAETVSGAALPLRSACVPAVCIGRRRFRSRLRTALCRPVFRGQCRGTATVDGVAGSTCHTAQVERVARVHEVLALLQRLTTALGRLRVLLTARHIIARELLRGHHLPCLVVHVKQKLQMTALLEDTVKRRLELLRGGFIEIRLRHGERQRVVRSPAELSTGQHVVEHDVVVLHLEEDRVTVQIVERARIILRAQMELLGDPDRDLLPPEQLLLDRLLERVDRSFVDKVRT